MLNFDSAACYSEKIPLLKARRTSPTALCTPVFFMMLVRCVSTVRCEIDRSFPISLLDRPETVCLRISVSLQESAVSSLLSDPLPAESSLSFPPAVDCATEVQFIPPSARFLAFLAERNFNCCVLLFNFFTVFVSLNYQLLRSLHCF